MADEDDSNRTGSGGLPAHRSQPSQIRPWADPQEALRPATADDFLRELTGCLALCAASGMSDDDRKEWLITARATLSGIPADLLARGAAVARKYSDHPSKIVPAIIREIETPWENRKRAHSTPAEIAAETPRDPNYISPEDAAKILAEYGLKRDPAQPLVAGGPDEMERKLPPIHIPRSPIRPLELADHEVPKITGMNIGQIFEQRDRLRAEKLGTPAPQQAPEPDYSEQIERYI